MATKILCDFCNHLITDNEERYHVQLMEMTPDGAPSKEYLTRDVCRDCFYHLSRILRTPMANMAKMIFALNENARTA